MIVLAHDKSRFRCQHEHRVQELATPEIDQSGGLVQALGVEVSRVVFTYPVVSCYNCYIAVENHHFLWENPP